MRSSHHATHDAHQTWLLETNDLVARSGYLKPFENRTCINRQIESCVFTWLKKHQTYWNATRTLHFHSHFMVAYNMDVKIRHFRGASARGIKGHQGASQGINCPFHRDSGASARWLLFNAHMKSHVLRYIRSGELGALKF